MRPLFIVFILLFSSTLFSQNSINESLDTTKAKIAETSRSSILDAVKFKHSIFGYRKITTLEASHAIEYLEEESFLLYYPKIDFLITLFSDKNFDNKIIGLTMGSAVGVSPTLFTEAELALVIDCFKIGATMIKYRTPESSVQFTFSSGFGMLLPYSFSLPTNVKLLFTKNHFSVGTEVGCRMSLSLERWDEIFWAPRGSIIFGLRL
ncbi:MAG: hypothetical protein IPO21_12165 [Bacteroidales bacterium]|nr:hypothetical protein [Bacteroidales bacterium]